MAATRQEAERAFDYFLTLYRQVFESRGVFGKRLRVTITLLRFSGRAIDPSSNHQSDRIYLRHGAATHRQDPRLVSRESILAMVFMLGKSASDIGGNCMEFPA